MKEMLSMKALTENRSVTALQNGYTHDETDSIPACLAGQFKEGEMFPVGERFFEVRRAGERHMEEAQGDWFQTLPHRRASIVF